MIVDDSALVRQVLKEILNSDSSIDVVGTAYDPYNARKKIKELNPDVITLDIEMPRMDGIAFLKNIMRLRPMPVVMVSSLTKKGADVTLQALELGAIDFVNKPESNVAEGLTEYSSELISKVKIAARSNVKAYDARNHPSNHSEVVKQLSLKSSKHFKTTDKIIAIGASTGGTEAIKDVLINLPHNTPGIVITQHIPLAFSESFAKRVDLLSKMSVCQAEDGQQIIAGHAFIAPGDQHLEVIKSGGRYVCKLNDGPLVNRHKPSVDVLMASVAKHVGQNALGIMLTGMGADGAKSMKLMQEAGAKTIAQDEESSVVWGMPGSAVKLGGFDSILPLNQIAQSIVNHTLNNFDHK